MFLDLNLYSRQSISMLNAFYLHHPLQHSLEKKASTLEHLRDNNLYLMLLLIIWEFLPSRHADGLNLLSDNNSTNRVQVLRQTHNLAQQEILFQSPKQFQV